MHSICPDLQNADRPEGDLEACMCKRKVRVLTHCVAAPARKGENEKGLELG